MSRMSLWLAFVAALLSLALTLFETPARAETDSDAPRLPWKQGPETIALGHDISLALPENYAFLAQPHAGELLTKNGSLHTESVLGLVVPDAASNWVVVFRYEDSGYVKDDETIDAADLLKTIREGVEEDNKLRVERGFKPYHVDAWSEAPRYDRTLHQLVWALDLHDDESKTVNYNTRVLGRRGVVSVNLVTTPEDLANDKPHAATLLDATTFDAGARYSDFDSKTDKVAEYGLVGLILGGIGVAKLAKLGLLAAGWKWIVSFLIAAKKLVIVAFAAIAGVVKKLFGRRDTAEARRE